MNATEWLLQWSDNNNFAAVFLKSNHSLETFDILSEFVDFNPYLPRRLLQVRLVGWKLFLYHTVELFPRLLNRFEILSVDGLNISQVLLG